MYTQSACSWCKQGAPCLTHLQGVAGIVRKRMPGRVCKQRQQHGREQEVPQVIHCQLELISILRPQLRARHDACAQQAA